MAKLNVEIKPNGDIHYQLEFAGKTFESTKSRSKYTEDPALDEKVALKMLSILNAVLGEFDAEEVLGLICDIDDTSSTGTLSDIILALNEYETQLKAEAMP